MIKRCVTLMFIFTLLLSSYTYAEEETLTLEQAIDMATKDQSNIENMNDTIEDLWKNYYSAKDGKKQIESTLRTLDRFEELYDKKYKDGDSLDLAERTELEGYQMAFGNEPPKYTGQEMLDKFIRTRDLTWKSVYAEIQKLKNTRSTVMLSVEKGVRDLYNQVISLQTTLEQQQVYLNITRKQHDQLVAKFELGQVSNSELKTSEQNLIILEKQIEQISNNLFTLEMNFNQLIEAPITSKYNLVDTVTEITVDPIHKTLDEYLEAAILNRSEMKNARIDLEIKENEDEVIKKYLKNELLTDRVNADIALITAQHSLSVTEAKIIDNVSDGYISMLTYWNDYQLSLQSLNLKKKSLVDVEERFGLGQVTDITVELSKYSVLTAENTVKDNLRNYLNSVKKMENASSDGPGY